MTVAAPAETVSAAASPAPIASPSAQTSSDVAFDQVDIVTTGPYASSPGDFAKESAAVEDSAARLAANPGNGLTVMVPMKTLKRYAYWHGASRVENVLTHTVVIRQKNGDTVYLDTARKTYQTNAGGAIEYVSRARKPRAQQAGAFDLTVDIDARAAKPLTIDGKAARDYAFSLTATVGGASGSCLPYVPPLSLRATLRNATLNRADPAESGDRFSNMFTPETLSQIPFFDPNGCAIHTLTIHATDLAYLSAINEFYLYRRLDITARAPAGVNLPFQSTLISERGNVRDLTDADAALFDVPAGYTLNPWNTYRP